MACGRGSDRAHAGNSRHSPPTNSAIALATMPTWKPEIAIRWVSPVARRMCQSSRVSPRVSPSASARTKREEGEATDWPMRAAITSRQASTPAAPASRCARSGRCRWPVAPTRCSSACFSLSNPPGLRRPRGARSLTVSRQRSPARSFKRGPASRVPWSSCQDSMTRRPCSAAAGPSPSSTVNRNRVRLASCWGRSATVPVTTSGRRSRSGGIRNARDQPACKPAHANPTSNAPSQRPRQRHGQATAPAIPRLHNSIAAGSPDIDRQRPAPASSATAVPTPNKAGTPELRRPPWRGRHSRSGVRLPPGSRDGRPGSGRSGGLPFPSTCTTAGFHSRHPATLRAVPAWRNRRKPRMHVRQARHGSALQRIVRMPRYRSQG